jgi:hypothetical protein
LSNPVIEALLCAKANERLQTLGYEPPKSWTKEAKLRFLELPADLQAYLVIREKQRDREVRRAQNEAADARKALAKALAAIQQPKETENGTEQNASA